MSDDYASLNFKYCDEHPDFTIKQLDASDAIARRGNNLIHPPPPSLPLLYLLNNIHPCK